MGNCDSCGELCKQAGKIIDSSGEQGLLTGEYPDYVQEDLKASLSEGCGGPELAERERHGFPRLLSAIGIIKPFEVVSVCTNPLFSDPSFITEKSQA